MQRCCSLLQATLELDPKDRLTIEECFQHPGLAHEREQLKQRLKESNCSPAVALAKADSKSKRHSARSSQDVQKSSKDGAREHRRKTTPRKSDENKSNNPSSNADTDKEDLSKKGQTVCIKENKGFENSDEVHHSVQSNVPPTETGREWETRTYLLTEQQPVAVSNLESPRQLAKQVFSGTHLSDINGNDSTQVESVDRTKRNKISIGSTFTDLFQDKPEGQIVQSLRTDVSEAESLQAAAAGAANLGQAHADVKTSTSNYSASFGTNINHNMEQRNGKVLVLIFTLCIFSNAF